MLRTLRRTARKLLNFVLRPDDRYYQDAYRKADLEADYWSIVGPSSPEEFTALGEGKKKLLIDRGLAPSSRVLDVGCGTGQLTAALDGYLSDAGKYVGTDIAPEALQFCRKRFPRPNFRFVLNEMTRVPIEGESFDYIFFGSVFTHMYPAEVTAMLTDMQRLLADGGSIVADAFFAPGIGTSKGERGAVVIDEALLMQCFERAGYGHEIIDVYEWAPGVQRANFHLQRK
jgi:ubiquinone/menaquinone biosynthesis C-methylase UbiE